MHVGGIGRLVVIGGGRMGEAIVGGLLAADAVRADDVTVVEPSDTRRVELAAAHGVRVAPDAHGAVGGAGIVLIAVKPQIVDVVLSGLARDISEGTLVVSIAAGISCSRMELLLPAGTAVVRVMPNTPALVGSGMAVISGGAEAGPDRVETVRAMFASIGDALVIEERYQDAATAISGSGPAYVALFVDALARAGVREGLSREVAQRLAIRTLRGTADLIEATGQHPEAVVDAVASPGGTTIAAVTELEARGFRAAVAAAVRAAAKRARELGAS